MAKVKVFVHAHTPTPTLGLWHKLPRHSSRLAKKEDMSPHTLYIMYIAVPGMHKAFDLLS